MSANLNTHDLGNDCELLVGNLPQELVWTVEEFAAMWLTRPAGKHKIMMHGHLVDLPRGQAAHGKDYHFSGTRKVAGPIPESLMPLTTWVQTNIHAGLNGLLANYYDGPTEYIGPHHDSVKNMVKDAPIVTVSFGETRVFRMTLEGNREKKTIILDTKDFPAPNGTVFVMPYNTNLAWKHSVPKSTRYTGRRISVTFRAFE